MGIRTETLGLGAIVPDGIDIGPQNRVHAGLVSPALGLEPVDDIAVEPHRQALLRTVRINHLGRSPERRSQRWAFGRVVARPIFHGIKIFQRYACYIFAGHLFLPSKLI